MGQSRRSNPVVVSILTPPSTARTVAHLLQVSCSGGLAYAQSGQIMRTSSDLWRKGNELVNFTVLPFWCRWHLNAQPDPC